MYKPKPGERVKNLIHGYYSGMEGTVLGAVFVQYDNCIRYRVELDNGLIVGLKHFQMEKVDPK